MIEDCLHKDPQCRPPHATAIALRLGLGDNEIMGLGLGLAWSAEEHAPSRPTPDDTLPDTIAAELP